MTDVTDSAIAETAMSDVSLHAEPHGAETVAALHADADGAETVVAVSAPSAFTTSLCHQATFFPATLRRELSRCAIHAAVPWRDNPPR